MKKKVISLLLSFAILFAFAGCRFFGAELTVTNATDKGTFSMTIPYSWDDMNGRLNSAAEIEVGSSNLNAYVIALMESISDFEEGYSLAEYANSIITANMDLFVITLDELSATQINGFQALKGDFSYIDENDSSVRMWLYCVQTEDCFGQILGWTPEINLPQAENELVSVIESFTQTY